MSAPIPGQQPQLLFDAAVEVMVVDEDARTVRGLNPGEVIDEPVVILFGTVVPTACEHTHVEELTTAVQPWN